MANLLEKALIDHDAKGILVLRTQFNKLLNTRESDKYLVKVELLKDRVYRFHFQKDGQAQSLIAKRHKPDIAQRNHLVISRWLPAVELTSYAPRLLGTAAEDDGSWIWLVHEDLGDETLDSLQNDKQRVKFATQAIADFHQRFADHPLLAECRLWGGDLGITFFQANVRDAYRSLQAISAPTIVLNPEQAKLRNRLLERLQQLNVIAYERADLFQSLGAPETLLHGDLWIQNVFVLSHETGYRFCLIDWDHVAVGPLSYDLSTFLLRFPERERTWVLDAYLTALGDQGWPQPKLSEWNLLFESAELSRITNRLIWPALTILDGDTTWAFDTLTEVESWYDDLKPVLSEQIAEPPS